MHSIYGRSWVVNTKKIIDVQITEHLLIVKDHQLKSSIIEVRNQKNSSKDILAYLVALDMSACELVLVHAFRL